MDRLDGLPDDLLLHILSYLSSQDIKSLIRCSAVSRRFSHLVPLVPSLLIHVDCHICFWCSKFHPSKCPIAIYPGRKFSAPLFLYHLTSESSRIRSLFSKLLNLLQPHGFNSSPSLSVFSPSSSPSIVHRHPLHIIDKFSDLRTLRIVIPRGELSLSDDSSSSSTLLCWRVHFGFSLKSCLILTAAATTTSSPWTGSTSVIAADKATIPDSLHEELSCTLTKSSLSSAALRQLKLWRFIEAHKALQSLVVTDEDGQGVLLMDRDELEEVREKPISKRRTMSTAEIRKWEWFAPMIELSSGMVLKGATLIAVLPRTRWGEEEEKGLDLGWVEGEFEGMHAEAVRMLVKGRKHTYREMNCSF